MSKPIKLHAGRLKEFTTSDTFDSNLGGVPTYIAPTATYTIAQYTQALFSVVIDVDGVLEMDVCLLEV
jgi:hypothetical protein